MIVVAMVVLKRREGGGFLSNIYLRLFAVCFRYLVFCCSETQVKKRLSSDPEKTKNQRKEMLLKTFYFYFVLASRARFLPVSLSGSAIVSILEDDPLFTPVASDA